MHRYFRAVGAVAVAAFLSLASEPALLAQKPDSRVPDEAAVRRAGKEYRAALERGDACAIAEFWTADGSFVDESGRAFKVHELMRQSADPAEAMQRPRIEVSDVHLRFVTADVAIEEGTCETTATSSAAPVTGRFTAIWVLQKDKWRLDSLREFRAASQAHRELLASLEPFVGDWLGTENHLTMSSSVKWNATETFLHRDLSVTADGKQVFSGTQQVGWDPTSREIKSWSFNSDGSRSEAVWSLEGNAWLVVGTKVLPDGKSLATTQAFKFSGPNTLIWKSMKRDAAGQLVPDLEIKFTRKKVEK